MDYVEYMILYWELEGNSYKRDEWEKIAAYMNYDKSMISQAYKDKLKQKVKPGDPQRQKACAKFMKIMGVGPKTALDWWKKGWSILGDIDRRTLNKVQRLGLVFYKDLNTPIPAQEIENLKTVLGGVIDSYWVYAGSYRRQKPTSRDIDVLAEDHNIEKTKQNIMNHPAFVDVVIGEDSINSFRVLWRSEGVDNKTRVRKFDLKFSPKDEWWTHLAYFTGSKLHNQRLRTIAHKMKLKLNQKGLFRIKDGSKIDIGSEQELYKVLGQPWCEPKDRWL